MLFPTELATEFEPLTLDLDLGERGNAAVLALAEHGFVVATGVHEQHLGRLAAMSGEDHIIEYCPRDPSRFESMERVAKWLTKGRVMVGIYDTGGKFDLTVPDAITAVPTDELTKVAYGWFGQEPNKHIPQGDITTAYRVSMLGRELSRERRHDADDTFKLGYPLGELTTAVAVKLYGVEADRLSLETWRSNGANALYDMMGYQSPDGLEPVPDVRPTLQPVGAVIDGNEVYFDQTNDKNMVQDARLYKILTEHPLLQAA